MTQTDPPTSTEFTLPAVTRRRVTIRDVARHANISVTTVSRVISGSPFVAAATRERVEHTIGELGFVVNAHARALTGAAHPIVACLVSEMVSNSFAELAAGIEAEATAAGNLFVLSTTHGDAEREREIIDSICEQRARAVVFVGATHDGEQYQGRMAEFAEALARTDTRLVLCGRPSLPQLPEVSWVGYDDVAGARAVTEHLLELGHRRILVVGDNGASTARARTSGYREGLANAGVPADPQLVPFSRFSAEGGYRAVQEALASGTEFTAVFGLADHVAIGALRALREAGLQVPGDISLAGFDDIPYAPDFTPGLTTVRVDFSAVGRRAAELGVAPDPVAIASAQNLFPATLVVRDSTAPPASSHRCIAR